MREPLTAEDRLTAIRARHIGCDATDLIEEDAGCDIGFLLATLAAREPLDVEALLHLAMRRHEHSDGCDGCLNVQRRIAAALSTEPES